MKIKLTLNWNKNYYQNGVLSFCVNGIAQIFGLQWPHPKEIEILVRRKNPRGKDFIKMELNYDSWHYVCRTSNVQRLALLAQNNKYIDALFCPDKERKPFTVWAKII